MPFITPLGEKYCIDFRDEYINPHIIKETETIFLQTVLKGVIG